MSIFDKAKDLLNDGSAVDKAKDLVNGNEAKVDQAVERAGDIVDEKTGDKFSGQVDKGQSLIQDKTGNL